MTQCLPVPASGDNTGQHDTKALEAALSAPGILRVLLDGRYFISRPLVAHARDIVGLSRSVLQYVGEPRDDYALTIRGGTDQTGLVSQVAIACNHRCRGVRLARCAGIRALDMVRVESPRVVGVDLIDCWGSSVDNLLVNESRGIALRSHRCNSFTARNVLILRSRCLASTKPEEHTALTEHACDHGRDAARAYYNGTQGRGQYTEDWPDPAEDWVCDISGIPVRTPANQRASVVIANERGQQDLTLLLNVVMEGLYCADYPAITIQSSTTEIRNLRLEKAYLSDAAIHIHGRNVRFGANITIANTMILAERKPQVFVRAYDYSRSVCIDQLSAVGYVTRNIVQCDRGQHDNIRVVGALSSIPDGQIVSSVNGAVVNA